MTWKKLLAGATGVATVFTLVGLSNCTITTVDCKQTPNDPICQPSGKDSSTPDTSTNDVTQPDSGSDASDSGGKCAAIPSLVYFDNAMGTGMCDTCMAASCCAPVTTCFSDKGDAGADTCSDFDNCLGACKGLMGQALTTCVDACKMTHPNSVQKWTDYANCTKNNCMAQCK